MAELIEHYSQKDSSELHTKLKYPVIYRVPEVGDGKNLDLNKLCNSRRHREIAVIVVPNLRLVINFAKLVERKLPVEAHMMVQQPHSSLCVCC